MFAECSLCAWVHSVAPPDHVCGYCLPPLAPCLLCAAVRGVNVCLFPGPAVCLSAVCCAPTRARKPRFAPGRVGLGPPASSLARPRTRRHTGCPATRQRSPRSLKRGCRLLLLQQLLRPAAPPLHARTTCSTPAWRRRGRTSLLMRSRPASRLLAHGLWRSLGWVQSAPAPTRTSTATR